MSKLDNLYQGRNGPHFQLLASSIKWFELFFSKMVKLEEKDSPFPKIIMFNMFVWFYHIFLISELNTCSILM